MWLNESLYCGSPIRLPDDDRRDAEKGAGFVFQPTTQPIASLKIIADNLSDLEGGK